MKQLRNIRKENLIYTGLWTLLFATPVLSLYIRSNSSPETAFRWQEIFHVWTVYALFLLAFLIHNFILAPQLVYKQRKRRYLALTGCMVVIFMLTQCASRPQGIQLGTANIHFRLTTPGLHENETPPDRKRPVPAPDASRHSRPDRQPRSATPPVGKHLAKSHPGGPARHLPPIIFGQTDIANTIALVLLIGMNLGIKLYFKQEKDAEERAILEKQHLEQQLEYLKYQINPHFFMNTLNNIHALVDINPDKAKESIVEMSKMMRYVLYEADKPMTPLVRELEFLKNYIRLMKLRYSDIVKITTAWPEHMTDSELPPLLLITFIENAFKHGVTYHQETLIDIGISLSGGLLRFRCANTRSPLTAPSHAGVGLANVKKRLELIYGETYRLDIDSGEQTYEVRLTLPLLPPSSPQTGRKATSHIEKTISPHHD